MIDIRTVRRSRGLTLTDLAALSGLPARALAEIEQGLRPLEAAQRHELAQLLNVPASQLCAPAGTPAPGLPHALAWARRGFSAALVLCAGLLLLVSPVLNQPPATARARAAGLPTAQPRPTTAVATATSTASPRPTVTPAPTATPRFTLAADGPHGCPLAPTAGRVVHTQGYGEGTHAPVEVWGAIDLAVDGDGDDNADPGATQGQPISATLGGVAHVFLGTWPAGNYVRVENSQAGWSSAYAHLDTVAVSDGQVLAAGTVLGTVGSTGMTSGPHLHYEVWHGTQNIDPSTLLGC